jgi:hypothetical protein
MLGAAWQAATWRIRRATRSRRFIATLTPWAAGLVLNAGDMVQSGGLAWRALNDGTAGATAPNNLTGATFADGGGVSFVHVALLTAPQPTI